MVSLSLTEPVAIAISPIRAPKAIATIGPPCQIHQILMSDYSAAGRVLSQSSTTGSIV
jgi:hypothetical protein